MKIDRIVLSEGVVGFEKDAWYGMIHAFMGGIVPIFTRERETASRLGLLVRHP